MRALPTILLAALGALARPLCGQEDDAKTVEGAERAFSARCQQVGIRDSFLEFFAADAVHFFPEPRPARPDLTAQTATSDLRLRWSPATIVASAASDLAWSAGPFRLQAGDGPEQAGWFVTLWRRTPQGWRVALDAGVDGPSPRLDIQTQTEVLPGNRSEGGPSPSFDALTARERLAFAPGRTYAEGRTTAASAGVPASVFRERLGRVEPGTGPGLGTEPEDGLTVGEIDVRGGESSGPLGYAYGNLRFASPGKPAPSRAHFLHVWVWNGNAWELRGDLLTFAQ